MPIAHIDWTSFSSAISGLAINAMELVGVSLAAILTLTLTFAGARAITRSLSRAVNTPVDWSPGDQAEHDAILHDPHYWD